MNKLTLSGWFSHPSFATAKVGCLLAACLCFALSSVHAQTQATVNAQARADFERADAELNRTYQALLTKLPDAKSKQELKEKQRAWVASRDVEVARATNEANGGSMAPMLRYETLTHLTRERIKELEAMLDHGTASGPNSAASESESKQASSVSEAAPIAAPTPYSISPDKQWEYKGGRIVKAGTTQVVLDLDQELEVYDPEMEILWAPDSKRFGFNYGPLHAHHTTYKAVSFYQLRAEKWVGLRSPEDDLVKLAKELLPKKVHKSRDELIPSIVKVRNWTDARTVILFSAWRPWQFSTHSNQLKAAFLLTLEFDENGNWKIVKKHRLSQKEIEQFNSED